MDEADVRIVTGEQGSGKSTTAVALVVDDCFENVKGVIAPSKSYMKASTLNDSDLFIIDDIPFLKGTQIPYNPHKHIRLYSPHNNDSKIIAKPRDFVIDSTVKVFSNFKFYGIRYMMVDLPMIIENMNTEVFRNAWIILDESFMTEKRDTMSNVGKMMAWFGAQARRRNLHLVIIAQYMNMVQSRFNLFARTRVLCSYDKHTHMIDIEVNDSSEVMQSTGYFAPEYWKYFKHDELVKVPQYRIDKTLEVIYS